MKEANLRAHVVRLVEESNHLGAYLYLKDAEVDRQEYVELVGVLAGAVFEELSSTRRDDRERIYYLRSVLAWILRDVPGLGSLYREQLRDSRGGGGLLSSITRGIQNAEDFTSGRKSVSEGFQDATEDVRRSFENAADAVKSGEAGSQMNEFLSSAETGIRRGLDQLGEFFKTLNEQAGSSGADDEGSAGEDSADIPSAAESDAQRAARADAERDVEDASFEPDDHDTSAD
ncbi:MAG: hypothetical protein V3S41_09910 [Spirochaetia bacterium]